jgi:translation initiation factor 2 subunit 2
MNNDDDAEPIDQVGTRKAKSSTPTADAKADDDQDDDVKAVLEDLKGKKKKKKKKAAPKAAAEGGDEKDTADGATHEAKGDSKSDSPWEGTDRDYTYTELLDRVFKTIRQKNPNAGDRKQIRLPPAVLERVGTRKSSWTNFAKTCSALQRSQDHVMQFFMAELATEGSLDGQSRLVMRGKFNQAQIESLIRKYFMEYVACGNCKSSDTTLTRDPTTRLYFISCSICQARRSVAPIKSGFHATSRADRRAARA